MEWYVLKTPHNPLALRKDMDNAGLLYYLPTHYVVQNIGGYRRNVERSLILNFIFVRSELSELKSFVASHPTAHLVYGHRDSQTGKARLMVVPDKEMDMFQRTLATEVADITVLPASGIDLSKGDKVRIISGPFSGVEGTLLSSQGKDGGRVLVNVSDLLYISTLEIAPEDLQVLSFAVDNKHIYKKFNGFYDKVRIIMRTYLSEGNISVKDRNVLEVFLRRYSALETFTTNSQLKLDVFLLLCHFCLEQSEELYLAESRLIALLSTVNSDIYKAFAMVQLYGCTNKLSYAQEALKIIENWRQVEAREKQKREIIEDIRFYQEVNHGLGKI